MMQLALMTDDVPKKKELLRDCREKLNKAIKVNADSVTPDGQLAIFQLANAFCECFHVCPSTFLIDPWRLHECVLR